MPQHNDASAHVSGSPRTILRLEGAAVFVASLYAYGTRDASWLALPFALFLPDLFMVGYLSSTRLGATLYNLGHTYVVPALLALASLPTHEWTLLTVACVWTAHIGMDRALGYGLKYPDAFTNTHLGRIGHEEHTTPDR